MSFFSKKGNVALLLAFFGFLSGTYAGTQSINMPQSPQFTDWRAYGDAPFDLTASATSGLPVTFTSSNTNVATISGNRVTVRGVGQTTITASQAGNGTYDPAAPVSRTLWVNKADQVINFSPISTKTFGDAPFNLNATGGGSGNPIVFASLNTNVATISGNTVTIVGGGYARITYSQAGNDNYEATGPTEYGFNVQAANQVVSFPNLPTKKVGDSPFSAGASVTFGLPLSYSSSNTNVATVSSSGLITIVGAGSTMITASNPGNSNFNSCFTGQQLFVEQGLSSVDGTKVTLDFQGVDPAGWVSDLPGWSTSEPLPANRPDGYTLDENNTNNILGMVGGFYTVPSSTTTDLTYNFDPGNSNRYVFEWTQNIHPSSEGAPGNDIFGWKFLSGTSTAFEIKFVPDTSGFTNNIPNFAVQGYDGAGTALTQAAGQPNLWGVYFKEPDDFRLTADLANKTWTLDVWDKSKTNWFGLVTSAVINSNFTSLNGMAATWTVTASNGVAGAGDNFMAFDNITIQGKQTVTIALNLPTNSVYNGSAQTVSPTTTPSGVALVLKYNTSTNAPVNAGTYTVTAEVVDTNAYYSAPTSGSWTIAKATPTITSNPTALPIFLGQKLSNSTITPGEATGVGGVSLSGEYAFTYPNSTPSKGTPSVSVTFTPLDANYATTTVDINVTVLSLATPWDVWADARSLTGSSRAPSADPDGDGFSNAQEFAFGTDPAARTTDLFSAATVGSNYVVTFKKRKLTSDATYEFRSSTDLTQAFSAGTLLEPSTPSSVDADYEEVTVSIPITGERGFIRGQANVLVGPTP